MSFATTNPATGDELSGAPQPLPEFGRTRDVERLFGLKRGITYRLIADGSIKSIVLRKRGNKTGVRLIHLASVRAFLLGQLHEQFNNETWASGATTGAPGEEVAS